MLAGRDPREVIEIRGGQMLRLVAPVARYTRFVAVSKRFLIVLVLGVLGLVIWIGSDKTEGGRVVFSGPQKVEPLENMMDGPHYRGVDSKNQPYTVTADKAVQVDPQTVNMINIRADMTLESGEWIALDAGSGELNTQTKKLQLRDSVTLFYDGGYEFRTERAHVDIQAGNATGDMPVEGQGPTGTIKAKSFALIERGRIIQFNGSVITTLYP